MRKLGIYIIILLTVCMLYGCKSNIDSASEYASSEESTIEDLTSGDEAECDGSEDLESGIYGYDNMGNAGQEPQGEQEPQEPQEPNEPNDRNESEKGSHKTGNYSDNSEEPYNSEKPDNSVKPDNPEKQEVSDIVAVTAMPEVPRILKTPKDIELRDTDGSGTDYVFEYDGEEYTAVYTEDNWKIIDSYKITNMKDMIIICKALRKIHKIHGSDMISYRTAKDMAYEWQQHNLAYYVLPDGNRWKSQAKDVDINPEDQGKSVLDFYIEKK